jgi:hypothetical protein
MLIQELDDFICQKAAVGGKGVMDCLAVLFGVILEERDDLLYQLEREKRFSAVKIKVIVFGQPGQKKISAFSASE